MLKSCLTISGFGKCHVKKLISFGIEHLSVPIYRVRGVLQSMQAQAVCIPTNSFHTCNSLHCLRIDPRMSITFKCNVCEEKSTKTFSKEAYEKGMVIITCPNCKSKHLIANNIPKYRDLGLGNIEDFLAAKGQKVKKGLDIKENKNDQNSLLNQNMQLDLDDKIQKDDESHKKSEVHKQEDKHKTSLSHYDGCSGSHQE